MNSFTCKLQTDFYDAHFINFMLDNHFNESIENSVTDFNIHFQICICFLNLNYTF